MGPITNGRDRRVLSLMVVLSLFAAFLFAATPAMAAKPGNSVNAKLCKKWQSLYRSDGTPFANRDDCVSYGAKGGMILTEPPVPPLPNELIVLSGSTPGTYEASGAEFGPQLSVTGVTGTLYGTFGADGCSAADYAGLPIGSIPVIASGSCTFVEKVLQAQAGGAGAVVIYSDVPNQPPTTMGTSAGGEFVTIPSVMISQYDGLIISQFGNLPADGIVRAKS